MFRRKWTWLAPDCPPRNERMQELDLSTVADQYTTLYTLSLGTYRDRNTKNTRLVLTSTSPIAAQEY